uniref:Uncharacterized protein n=1 Tax=Cyanothece sp. (strain PCC 7425 / ATCC 29141) TaxID=395961 RepID=B8HRS6_CYAP4
MLKLHPRSDRLNSIDCLERSTFFSTSLEGWSSVIALEVVYQALEQGLFVQSLKRFSSGFVAVFLMLEPTLSEL